MKKSNLIIALLSVILCSCDTQPPAVVKQQREFEIAKYRGYEVVQKLSDQYDDTDLFLIRNDSIAFELVVPSWFSEMYEITDTIQ